jgi:hypothetical protein
VDKDARLLGERNLQNYVSDREELKNLLKKAVRVHIETLMVKMMMMMMMMIMIMITGRIQGIVLNA